MLLYERCNPPDPQGIAIIQKNDLIDMFLTQLGRMPYMLLVLIVPRFHTLHMHYTVMPLAIERLPMVQPMK